jgi:hypothetical protein
LNQSLPLQGTLWGTTPVAKGTLFCHWGGTQVSQKSISRDENGSGGCSGCLADLNADVNIASGGGHSRNHVNSHHGHGNRLMVWTGIPTVTKGQPGASS